MDRLSSLTSSMKKMKLSKGVHKVLEDKAVLYVVLFLAVATLLGYVMIGNTRAVIVFVLLAYITHNFTKNMIIVLAVPLVFTSMLIAGSAIKEGLTNKADPENPKKEEKYIAEENTPADEKKKDDKDDKDKDDKDKDDKDKKPEEFTGYSQNTNRVDYAATIEDAYDDLHKMIGEGGIKSLTADTKKLMNQQLELADAMKNMGPLMDQAKSMMDGFDFKNMGDMSSLMKTFNPNSNE